MNQAVEENEFRRGLERLFADIQAELAPAVAGPYEEGGAQLLLEHGTRIFFFDRLLQLLGWELGTGGNVAEEARIRTDKINFLDYVGLHSETRAPALIVEAKAWDKPPVRSAPGKLQATDKQLIVEAIRHINCGGRREDSPVILEWHDNLSQIAGYVKASKDNYGNDVPCAVLASGRWMVIFTDPGSTFVEGAVNEEHLTVFFEDGAIQRAAETVFRLLSRSRLSRVVPSHIRPTQVGHYLTAGTTAAVYHAVLVAYKSTGSQLFTQIPQIQIYAALLLQRDDGVIFTVVDGQTPVQMDLDREDGLLTSHIGVVAERAAALLEACSAELKMDLQPFALTDFPGFDGGAPADALLQDRGTQYVRPIIRLADEWIIATGDRSHYLLSTPSVECRFHEWGACREVGGAVGNGAISTPTTETPRAFFVDGIKYHCAHQTVVDRRKERCHIAPLDGRTCCRSCALQVVCWTEAELQQLPCGT